MEHGLEWPDPVPPLGTPRLELRALSLGDAAEVATVYADPAITRFLTLGTMTDVSDAEAAINAVLELYAARRAFRWVIRLRESGQLIGTVGYLNVSEPNQRAEVSIDLARGEWGAGIAVETGHAVLPFGFNAMQLRRIEADIHPDNAGSIRVVEKLGFTYEGLLRDYWFMKGRPESVRRYSLLPGDVNYGA